MAAKYLPPFCFWIYFKPTLQLICMHVWLDVFLSKIELFLHVMHSWLKDSLKAISRKTKNKYRHKKSLAGNGCLIAVHVFIAILRIHLDIKFLSIEIIQICIVYIVNRILYRSCFVLLWIKFNSICTFNAWIYNVMRSFCC